MHLAADALSPLRSMQSWTDSKVAEASQMLRAGCDSEGCSDIMKSLTSR